MNKTIICLLLIISCGFVVQSVKAQQVSATDPNESIIPDNYDFKKATVGYNASNGDISAEVTFYSSSPAIAGSRSQHFLFYISTANSISPEYLVECYESGYVIKEMVSGSPGRILSRNRANLINDTYRFKFPVANLGLSTGRYMFRCWFGFVYTQTSDVMPNNGSYMDLKVKIP